MRKSLQLLLSFIVLVMIGAVSCDEGQNRLASDDQPPGAPPPGAPPPAEAPAPVPKTGQTSCWAASSAMIECAGTGQDGDIQAGVTPPSPRFTDNANGTVTDNLTGLVWLKNANCMEGMLQWSDALIFANTLKSGDCGLSDGSMEGDWYLPNVRQLFSLIDFQKANGPVIPTPNPFMNLQSGNYWSSTSSRFLRRFAWVVGLSNGSLGGSEKAETANFVTAVRENLQPYTAPAPLPKTGQTESRDAEGTDVDCAGTGQDGDIQAGVESPDPRFTDNGDGTITDNLTGLVWLKNANCYGTRMWEEALSDANTLEDGECGLADGSMEGDWSLPNVRQLESLVNYELTSFSNVDVPALPPSTHFTDFEPNAYWSSTTDAPSPNVAITVDFSTGGTGGTVKNSTTSLVYVLPVRDGG